MEFFDVIKKRRSIRSFNSKEVDPIKIENLIKAAFWSPSFDKVKAINLFIIREKDTIKKLATSTPYSSVLRATNTIILIGYDSEVGNHFEVDTSMAAMSIMLTATDMNLSTCYVQIHKESGPFGDAEAYTRNLISAPDKIKILGAIALGYTDQREIIPHTESEIIRKNVHYNLYGIH
ncbi:MAG: nitroreductase family protein [Deltaproteobacteria bacterium]|nr:nitroreductase family protein [Deltaproteobacteria bacterium]